MEYIKISKNKLNTMEKNNNCKTGYVKIVLIWTIHGENNAIDVMKWNLIIEYRIASFFKE